MSLSSVTVVTLACRVLRRMGLSDSTTGLRSRLSLRMPLVRDARPGLGVVDLDGGCGVGVLRRLADRTPLRSAIVIGRRVKYQVVACEVGSGEKRLWNGDAPCCL